MIDEQQPVSDLTFMGMRVRRGGPLGHQPGPGRVGDVEDGGAHPGAAGTPDIQGVAFRSTRMPSP